MREFKSFFKTVEGNEGNKCHYPTRLDTYGCGCYHDCKYCYAKSLLSFRNLWFPDDPNIADIKKIEKKIASLKKGSVVRLGGMTDCFQPLEQKYKVTYNTIKLLNKYNIHYLIVTKSNMIATDEYMSILNKKLAHIQITVTSTNDNISAEYERATPSSLRIKAIETLQTNGFDVAIRISPFIPEYIDFSILNNIKCSKAIVEFLRVNAFIKKTFDIDFSHHTHSEGGYFHLPLEYKKQLIEKITGFPQISVCEDCTKDYEFWQSHINFNPYDCCNLSIDDGRYGYWGNIGLLHERKIAFLSSQKFNESTKYIVEQWAKSKAAIGECIISGFNSKLELEVLDKLLASNNSKIILVLAKSLPPTYQAKFKHHIQEGRMLIISPYKNTKPFMTKTSAKKRNEYILKNCCQVVVGDLDRNGMLSELLKDTNFEILGKRI